MMMMKTYSLSRVLHIALFGYRGPLYCVASHFRNLTEFVCGRNVVWNTLLRSGQSPRNTAIINVAGLTVTLPNTRFKHEFYILCILYVYQNE